MVEILLSAEDMQHISCGDLTFLYFYNQLPLLRGQSFLVHDAEKKQWIYSECGMIKTLPINNAEKIFVVSLKNVVKIINIDDFLNRFRGD